MSKMDRVQERVPADVFLTIEEIGKKANLSKGDVEYLVTTSHPESFKSEKNEKQETLYALNPQ